MKISFSDKNHAWPAPCQGARNLLVILFTLTTLVVLATAANLWRPDSRALDNTGGWMQALALSAPALWPAGSSRRHAEMLHPGVDLRYAVGLETAP